jgi:hypothetical protein
MPTRIIFFFCLGLLAPTAFAADQPDQSQSKAAYARLAAKQRAGHTAR